MTKFNEVANDQFAVKHMPEELITYAVEGFIRTPAGSADATFTAKLGTAKDGSPGREISFQGVFPDPCGNQSVWKTQFAEAFKAFSPTGLRADFQHGFGRRVRIIGPAFFRSPDADSPFLRAGEIAPVLKVELLDSNGDTGGSDGDGDGGVDTSPPPSFQVVFPPEVTFAPMSMANGSSNEVKFTTAIDSSFDAEVRLAVVSTAPEGSGLHVSIMPDRIAAPGVGEGMITVLTGARTFPGDYFVTVFATAGDVISPSMFIVRVECTPPSILGVDQPIPVVDSTGLNVSLEARPEGSGPFDYQWYRGFRGMKFEPLGTSKTLTVPNESGSYWVRVSNACGSTDSVTARIP